MKALVTLTALPLFAANTGGDPSRRVLRIGSMTPPQLLLAVAPYIAHENETGLRRRSPGYARGLFAFADARQVDRVIVDLRRNYDGDPALDAALRHPQ